MFLNVLYSEPMGVFNVALVNTTFEESAFWCKL